jgi:ribonuclease D
MSSYTFIDTDSDFRRYMTRLRERRVTTIAMDVEGEFNLHVYGERFCLLQLYDGHEEVVVDPTTTSTQLFKELLENRDLLKIFYDCSSDRLLLAKTKGIIINSILDLRPAVEFLDFSRNDLKTVLHEALGLESSGGSKKRFQQYNWTRRPLDPEAIEYAVRDVRHLYELKDVLLRDLAAAKKLDEFILENTKRQDRDPDVNRKPGIFRSGRMKRLSREARSEFERIFEVRERHAKALDLPPNTVIANNDLFALAAGELEPDQLRGNKRVSQQKIEEIKMEISRGR